MNREIRKKIKQTNKQKSKNYRLRILQQVWKRKILRVTESSLLQCEEKKGAFWKTTIRHHNVFKCYRDQW